jgi:predicted lipase
MQDIDYYKCSEEFNAYGSDIDRHMREKFANKQIPFEERCKGICELKLWLRNGYGNEPLAKAFDNPILNAWRTSPYLWRKFRQKLYSMVIDIETDLSLEKYEL